MVCYSLPLHFGGCVGKSDKFGGGVPRSSPSSVRLYLPEFALWRIHDSSGGDNSRPLLCITGFVMVWSVGAVVNASGECCGSLGCTGYSRAPENSSVCSVHTRPANRWWVPLHRDLSPTNSYGNDDRDNEENMM